MKTVTKEVLTDGFRRLGLSSGQLVEVHSSLRSFGFVEGGALTVIDAIKEVVGCSGTIIMSGFLLSKPLPLTPTDKKLGVNLKLNILDEGCSRTGMGIIVDTFKTLPDVHCGTGMFQLAAWGHKACEYSTGDYSQIINKNSFALLLGVTYNRCSSLHLSENIPLPTKLQEYFSTPLAVENNYSNKQFIGYKDTLEEPFVRTGKYAESQELINRETIGQADCRLFKSQAVIDILRAFRKDRPYWLMGLEHINQ